MTRATSQIERNYESLKSDSRALAMIGVRRAVLKKISNANGDISWSKAKMVGDSFASPLAAQTVIKFAKGETRNPSRFTWSWLTEHVKGMQKPKTWIIDGGFTPPKDVKAVQIK